MSLKELNTKTISKVAEPAQQRFSIALVGGGPNALYCVERLLALVTQTPALASELSLTVVDKRGTFGAGCHYPSQPTTNHLNRIASQISFCADESNEGQVSALLPQELRSTLFTWCREQYERTKNERYEISEREWVDRSLFGEASCDVFQTYVTELTKRGLSVKTVQDRVTAMTRDGAGYQLSFESERMAEYHDAAVLCTGHTEASPRQGDMSFAYAEHALTDAEARYAHDVYPIEGIDAETVKPGDQVICRGLGLAAIDVMLRLTEGRGGYFVPTGDPIRPLKYIRSGFEPKSIVPFSSTGVFLFARAYNEKLNDSSLFETGVYFTPKNIDRLRETVGVLGPKARQLDYGHHILPLMIVEMQRIYYQTLFGKPAFTAIADQVQAAVADFVAGGAATFADGDAAMAALSDIATTHFVGLATRLETAIDGKGDLDAQDIQALQMFTQVYSGVPVSALAAEVGNIANLLAQPSPYLHNDRPSAHLFDWNRLIEPLQTQRGVDRDTLGQAAHQFFLKDLADATQGNISNPRKAAIDGVWRDMRDTVRYSVEFGRLLPDSQGYFMNVVHRITNRIAVGTSLKMMTKIMALVEDGVVDMSCGLAPELEMVTGGFQLVRDGQAETVKGQVLLNASVHRFDLARTEDCLYQSLQGEGLIREWCITGGEDGSSSFATGGVEVDPDTNLVIQRDGELNPNLGLLGAPSEGPLYFHLAAVRPLCSDPVIADADKVINALLRRLPVMQTQEPYQKTEETMQ
ncbi:MAG: FAD/NAD(P)-binding protein [Pseudophaeobacter sp.]|uniref:FAD/NAD(P)-binding protein n=1 Tax=Pseudophaeobacter sp. TaxID=1971739 RepID=UPI003296F8DE